MPASETAPQPQAPAGGMASDMASLALCSLIWGTTWFAITLQLGTVPANWSVVWRFGLAALALFGWCLIARTPIRMTRTQHIAAFLQGLFAFAGSYAFVYAAEKLVLSAVIAVIFAALAPINLVVFRLVEGRRASPLAWGGAALGVIGVAVLSGGQILGGGMDESALLGVGFGFIAVVASAVGNYFAWRVQASGGAIAPGTGWAMAYGAGVLALWSLARGEAPAFDLSVKYVGSLVYLSLIGSVVAFGAYYRLARRRGYGFASYIAAITPPVAMLISALFEKATWGWPALVGVAIVLTGQGLLIRAQKA